MIRNGLPVAINPPFDLRIMSTVVPCTSSSFGTSVFLNSVGIAALQVGRYRDACRVFADAVQAVRDETLGIELVSAEASRERNQSRLKAAVMLLQEMDSAECGAPTMLVVGVMEKVGNGFVAPSKKISCDFHVFTVGDGLPSRTNRELDLALMFYNYSISMLCHASDSGSTSTSRNLFRKSLYLQMLSRDLLGQCAEKCDDDHELERILRTAVCVLKNQMRIFERLEAPKHQLEQVQRNLSRLLYTISDLELLGVIQDASDRSPQTAPAA
jgi:hypothetical protein